MAYGPCTLSGDAFPIGEDTVGAIPGFKSASTGGTKPNWTIASTTFDTANYSAKSLVFWVVVWGEDAAGNLIQEQEGHGLEQNPANPTFKQITDVPIEGYSNNIGIHNSPHPSLSGPQQMLRRRLPFWIGLQQRLYPPMTKQTS